MKKQEKYYFEKTYLDEIPQFDKAVKTWLDGLEFDLWDMEINKAKPIDCRSRDGFIAAKHNHGGYERDGFTILSCAYGSGYSYGLGDAVEEQVNYGRECAKKSFMKEYATELQGIPEDKINYHDLHDLEKSKLAEKLDEFENEWNNEAVWLGIRVMFEGQDDKTKKYTLAIYVGGNISEYYGPFGKGSVDIATYEIKFKNVTELKKKLKAITKKIERSFA